MPVGFAVAYGLTGRPTDSWKQVCDPHLISDLVVSVNKSKSIPTWVMIVVGWTLAVVALAGPAWDKEKTQLFRSVDATVIVFDLSRSMNSTDLAPSRLERARYKALELIENLDGQSVGLIAFAGDAFNVTPVSDDIRTVTHLIQSLQTDMVPLQGSNASLGLYRATELLKRSGFDSGNVILLTDGIDANAFDAARELVNDGYRLSVVGIGTSIGAPVRFQSGEYLKDSSGEFVVALLDRDALDNLAAIGGGKLTVISNEASDLQLPWSQSSQIAHSDFDGDQVATTQWKDRGAWFLLPLIFIFAFIFKRGWVLGIALIVFAIPFDKSMAFEWSHLWQRSDQRAAAAVASQTYDDPSLAAHSQWSGIAYYRNDDFEAAAQEFEKSTGKIARYNQANALAKSGDLQGAIDQYEQALEIDPQFDDAQFNLDLVKKLLEQNQTQGEQQQSQEGESQDAQSDQSEADELERMPQGSDSDEQSDEQQQSEAEQQRGQQSQGTSEMAQKEKLQDSEPASEENVNMQALLDEEHQQVIEQLLRQVNEDPGGLLRRKFYYEAQSREILPDVDQPW